MLLARAKLNSRPRQTDARISEVIKRRDFERPPQKHVAPEATATWSSFR